MTIGRKLQALRNARNVSQESLAEAIGVSRQAVAKWEADQSLPELDKIISISDYYRVGIDSLLRCSDEANCGNIAIGGSGSGSLGQIEAGEVQNKSLIDFLCRAKKMTYAGKGGESSSSRPASHDLRHEEGDLFYLDSYLGGESFAGEEALWRASLPLWAMNYSGRLVGEGFSGDFLKECLSLVSLELPYRGPLLHCAGDFVYHSKIEGSFEWFSGNEEIFARGRKVYECRFHGGMIV